MKIQIFFPLVLILTPVLAGPAAYGVCQAGCASVVMACYPAAGFTLGGGGGDYGRLCACFYCGV